MSSFASVNTVLKIFKKIEKRRRARSHGGRFVSQMGSSAFRILGQFSFWFLFSSLLRNMFRTSAIRVHYLMLCGTKVGKAEDRSDGERLFECVNFSTYWWNCTIEVNLSWDVSNQLSSGVGSSSNTICCKENDLKIVKHKINERRSSMRRVYDLPSRLSIFKVGIFRQFCPLFGM